MKIEQSFNMSELLTSCQDVSFNDPLNEQMANTDAGYNTTTKDKKNTAVKNEISQKRNNRFRNLRSLSFLAEHLINSSKDEKKGVKTIIAIITGLLIGVFLFVVHYSFGYTLTEAGISMAILTLLICIGMAVSSFIRCITALVVPNFFTGVGRAILLSAIFALILNHPVSNISQNAKETKRSLACVVELAASQTRLLQPIEAIRKHQENLKAATDVLESRFTLVKDILDQLGDANTSLKTVREKCRNVVKSLETDCKRQFHTVEASTSGLRNGTLCANLNFSESCEEIRHDVDIEDIAKKARSAVNGTINTLNVDIVISGEFSVNVSQPTVTQSEAKNDSGKTLGAFDTAISVIRLCISLSLLFIFIKSFWYLRNYLAKDGYDNIYITQRFKEMDEEAEINGRETVLPLKKREKDKFVNTLSFRLNSKELSYSKFGLIQVLLHFILYIFVTAFDYALYYILNLVREYDNIEYNIESRRRMLIVIEGSGPLAELYKLWNESNDIYRGFNVTLDIEPCLPAPQKPSAAMIPVILVLYIITLAVVLLRAYGMRLRRKISAYYFPEQELERLDFLHKKIRHRRLGYLTYLRRHIRSTHKEEQVKNRFSFSSWLALNFPFVAKLLPKKNKLECIGCGQREASFHKVKLTKCYGPCDAVYCNECYTDLEETCPLCSSDDNIREYFITSQ